MKQGTILNFLKKIDKDEIEKQKIKLNEETTQLSSKSINFIRKRNKINLLDGLNYSPENCIIKNENRSNTLSDNNFTSLKSNKLIKISTPIKKIKIDKENFEPIIENNVFPNDSFEFSDFDDSSFDEIYSTTIEKKSFYRVKVLTVDHNEKSKTMICNIDDNGVKISINIDLEGNWCDTTVVEGDICHIINPIIVGNQWKLTDVQGLVIVNPDRLLSSTAIVGSLFCTRKTVLQNYFSDIGGKTNKAMLLGTFIHSIFQECVNKTYVDIDIVKEVANKLMNSKQRLMQFYEAELVDSEILKELNIYFPHIVKWIQKNISNNTTVRNNTPYPSKMVVDIEENLWSAKYGIKGKVDVTLKINNDEQTILPLELKTGKTSFSNEHVGQVILYTLMLSEKRETEINKGLLLYIKDCQEKVIDSKSASVIGLIKMRNELCKHLLRFLNSDLEDQDILPDVIYSERLCSNCEYLSLCTLFSRISKTNISAEHPMNKLIEENTQHLSNIDIQFFIRWTKLVLLEYLSIHRSEFTISKIVTQKSDNSIRNAIFECSTYVNPHFVLTFTFPPENNNNNKLFKEGDPIIISKDDGTKLALIIGFVIGTIGIGSISLSSEKPLYCSNETLLRLDHYNSLKIPLLNLSLLANFMSPSDIGRKLRSLIVNGHKPIFDSGFSKEIIEKIKPILKKSNSDQRKAILTALLAKDYALIKGYPGSGKTTCIVTMIRVFALIGAKVLVSSYTHSAVVNILMKLNQKETSFVYLNGSRSVCRELKPRTLDCLMESNNVKNVSDVHKLLEGISVFGVTCLSLHHPSLSKINFDLVIIDEAGQITLPISMMPLMKLKTENSRFVLVGDLHQLPPLVTNSTARTQGLDQSLLAFLCQHNHPRSISELRIQYRMNKEILKLCNKITYNNCIACASDTVANATFEINQENTEETSPLMARCLSNDIDHSVVFLDCTNKLCNRSTNNTHSPYSNDTEALLIVDIIDMFLKMGIRKKDIGVISPYNSQVELLLRLCACDIEINTIDQYQGKDKSIILISFVRQAQMNSMENDEISDIDILRDRRRLNVALTRAKHKLIMVGSLQHLKKVYAPLREVANVLTEDQIIQA